MPASTASDWWTTQAGDSATISSSELVTTMAISIRQIHHVFVGEVSGVDLTRPLAREEVAAIEGRNRGLGRLQL